MTNIMESLQAEFPFEQLGWKITHTFESQGRFFAYVAPFVDARAIQDRFDEVFGIDKWQVSYEKWGEKATKCTISVFLNERWISKEDGSEESDYSSVKGGFSNSLKKSSCTLGRGKIPCVNCSRTKSCGNTLYKSEGTIKCSNCMFDYQDSEVSLARTS